MSVWEFAIPEGAPLLPAPGAPVRFDQEKARMRALTRHLEDQDDDHETPAEECPACEGTGRGNPLPVPRSGPGPCRLCGGTGRRPLRKASA